MNQAKINNELNLTYPDSFKEMGEAELARYFGSPADRWGVYDADKHIILSVSWAKAGFMKSDAEMYLHGIEASMRLKLLNYQRVTDYQMKLGSRKAYGIRFEYRVNDSVRIHIVDMVTLKYKKNFYTLYFVTRKSKAAAELPSFNEVLKSITLS